MRKNYHKSVCTIFLILFSSLFLISCDLDQGLGPLETKISGNIIFFEPHLKPSNVGEVRIAALLDFPPSGLSDVFFSEPIKFDTTALKYELFLPEGDYTSVVLLWKPNGETWSFNSLLGVYGLTPTEFNLLPVSLSKETPVVEDVNMLALWRYASGNGKMNGKVTYQGVAPADTEVLLLVSFKTLPDIDKPLNSILDLSGLPLPISSSQNPRSYQLRVSIDDVHQFIGVFWKGFNTPVEELKLIGFYRNPDMPSEVGSVEIPESGTVNNIDFIADFNSLPDGIRP